VAVTTVTEIVEDLVSGGQRYGEKRRRRRKKEERKCVDMYVLIRVTRDCLILMTYIHVIQHVTKIQKNSCCLKHIFAQILYYRPNQPVNLNGKSVKLATA
jgi:hypothetical protein